jgi:hypothetical protein
MDPATADTVWFAAVVVARFVAPLFIPAFPLPGILACFLLDAADREIFELFTDLELADYQGFDKALDIFYLALAMLAVLRNWTHPVAARTARGLFYLRLVGVTAFELSGWRPFLLLFPNVFEFFFVMYEGLRTRWSPDRLSTRFFVVAAAVIWAVKLPQEFFLHVARLDVTDQLDEVLGDRRLGVVVVTLLVPALLAALWVVARAALPPPEHPLRLAAGPLPESIDEARERALFLAAHWRVVDLHLVEKIVLVSLVSVVFAQVLPRVDATPLQLTAGVAVVVTFNSFLTIRQARAGRSVASAFSAFGLLAAANTVFVLVSDLLLRRFAGGLHLATTLFFLLLLTLMVTLYDRWRPVYDVRMPAGSPT